MPKKFEKEFISYCENQNLEVNPNQIKVIKKLEDYYNSNYKSFFSKFCTYKHVFSPRKFTFGHCDSIILRN